MGVLVVVYVTLLTLGDTRAWSGADAGGKVATVRVMAERGSWHPDLGYWAAASDPLGTHHPLYSTTEADGRWVQVTSLPLVYAAVPLWRLGGHATILALPVLGSALAALGGRRLARAIGASSGWPAFWVVGLASPMLFYAGDFWEHAIAMGLALLAMALLLEQRNGRLALVAGLVAGVAVVLRTEVIVYAVTFGVGAAVVGEVRRSWLRRPLQMGAAVVGFLLPLVGNYFVERAILGTSVQSSRASAQASFAGDALTDRLDGGVLTTLGLMPQRAVGSYLAGALVVLLLAYATHRYLASRDDSRARAAAVAALGLLATRWAWGLGFVPGALPAAPVAAAGLVGARSPAARAVTVGALLAVPVVWAFQWRGQLEPQWGGRYLLLTGLLLSVVGAAAMERAGLRRAVAVLVIVAAAGVSWFGAAWHVRRTNAMAQAIATIEDAPADVVVVSNLSALGREAGAWYGDHRWLTGVGRQGLREAVAVARREGVDRIDVVQLDEGERPPLLVGFRHVRSRDVPFLEFEFAVHRYEATP